MRAVLFCVLAMAALAAAKRETIFTFRLQAGEDICLSEEATKGGHVAIEFQVLAGGSLDIDFLARGPDGIPLVNMPRVSDHLFEIPHPAPGIYQFCFSNSFSLMSHKDVFFMCLSEDANEIEVDFTFKGDELGNMTGTLLNVHHHLEEIALYQDHLRVTEARHRHLAEKNNSEVQLWSLVQCLCMLLIAALQVLAVRRFFRNTTKV
eukprot:m.243356 g.243356  ORF g.243356 m.243356 type:complete len:206 (+) comp14220_c0_seq1:36-653(+)